MLVSDDPVVKASGIGGRPLHRMKYIEAKHRISVVEIFTVSSNVKCPKELTRVLGQRCLPLYYHVFTSKLLSTEKKNKPLVFSAKNTSVERKVVIFSLVVF